MFGRSLVPRIAALLALCAMALASGCYTPKPVGVTYEATTQQKMQAVHHWDVLARDVANQIVEAVSVRDDLMYRPVYVERPNDSPFAQAFQTLVISNLVFLGQQVSVEEEDSLIVRYKVMAVNHKPEEVDPPPGTYAALPFGVLVTRAFGSIDSWLVGATIGGALYEIGRNVYAGQTSREIIITTQMSYNNRYVMHASNMYYMEDQEFDLQFKDHMQAKREVKSYRLVNE